ncbi:MAG: NAD(P)/FAD-dependent oxidoreductase [Nitrososphaeria archaeon]
MALDVAVVGAGPAGLSTAGRLASMGHSVIVIEEDSEIGYPVKCAGIMSSDGLRELRGLCGRGLDGVKLEGGEVEVRGKGSIELDIGELGAFAVDRRAIDKCLFEFAASSGAEFALSERALYLAPGSVVTRRSRYAPRIVVDARGAAAYPARERLLHAVQYTCRAPSRGNGQGKVRIVVDKGASREYFLWEVRTGDGELLLGGAGSSPASLEGAVDAMRSRTGCAPYRVVRSPIVVGGFSGPGSGGIFRVGDSAGNAKPLTGGGDVLSVVASGIASRAISEYLSGSLDLEGSHALYGRSWRALYGKEESAQKLLRYLYERMDEGEVWELLMRLKGSGALDRLDAAFDAMGTWLKASLGIELLGRMALRRLRESIGTLRGADLR